LWGVDRLLLGGTVRVFGRGQRWVACRKATSGLVMGAGPFQGVGFDYVAACEVLPLAFLVEKCAVSVRYLGRYTRKIAISESRYVL